MEYVDLVVLGEPAWARDAISRALAAQGFRLAWADEASATAERGNRVDGLLLGRRAPYLRVAVAVAGDVGGQSTLRLQRLAGRDGSGADGAQMRALRDELAETFRAAGALVTTVTG